MRGSVLTLSCPLGSPPMVGSAASLPVYEPVGGRLADFMPHWLCATDDTYIRGHSVRVPGETPSCRVPNILHQECKKGGRVIPPCGGDGQQGGPRTGPLPFPGFYINFFLVPKKLGGLRPVINLKSLNLFIKKEKFKMETIRSIQKALSPGDWVTSIDLKDAYFHIAVHPNFWKYLRIVVGGKVFQFKALPFGLSPREFCRSSYWAPYSTNSPSFFICTWTIGSS